MSSPFPLPWELTSSPANFLNFTPSVNHINGEGSAQPVAPNPGPPSSVFGSQISLIPCFSGEDDTTIDTFLDRIRIVSHFSQWSESQTLGAARLRLSGTAAEFAEYNPHVTDSYENFSKYMKERFTPKISKISLEKMFSSCIQMPMESVCDYSTRLRGCARKLRSSFNEPNSDVIKRMMDERLLTQFMAGLRVEIGRFVSVRNPRNMLEAEEFARLEEANTRNYASLNKEINSLLHPTGDRPASYLYGLSSTPFSPPAQPNYFCHSNAQHFCHHAADPTSRLGHPPQQQALFLNPIGGRNSFPPMNGSPSQLAHQISGHNDIYAMQPTAFSAPTQQRQNTRGEQPHSDTRVCYFCKKVGHIARNCHVKTRKCFNCGEDAHVSKDCPLTRCGLCNQNGHRPINCPNHVSKQLPGNV